MPETRNSKTSGGSPSADKNPSNEFVTTAMLNEIKQKEQILKVTRRIKPVGLYVNEDLAKETLDKREEQRPKLEEAKRNGKIAYFVLDKLIVKDRRG